MNKLVKGAVATAAGVALLMGGAGTFAYWNDSVGVSGATITAGNLVLTDATPSNGVWTVQKNGTGTATTVSNIAAFVVSPGDKFSYTKSVKFTATGDNLTAKLSLAPGSIVGAGSTPTAASNALAGYLQRTATLTATAIGTQIVVGTGADAGTFTITPGSTGLVDQTITVTVGITFPKQTDTTSTAALVENNTKLGSVNLTGLSVTINQQ